MTSGYELALFLIGVALGWIIRGHSWAEWKRGVEAREAALGAWDDAIAARKRHVEELEKLAADMKARTS